MANILLMQEGCLCFPWKRGIYLFLEIFTLKGDMLFIRKEKKKEKKENDFG